MPTINLPNYMKARGWLTDKERMALRDAARFIPEYSTIVNIGVEYGASVICLVAGRRNKTVKIVAIDIDNGPWEDQGYQPIENLELYLADSGAMAKSWNDPIRLLFIDGDHSYEGVMRDIRWIDHLLPSGLAIFHDAYEWGTNGENVVRAVCPDVNKAIDDWFMNTADSFYELQPVDSMRLFRKKR